MVRTEALDASSARWRSGLLGLSCGAALLSALALILARRSVVSGVLIVCVALALAAGLAGVLAGDGRPRRASEWPWVHRYTGWWIVAWAVVWLLWGLAGSHEPAGCACASEPGLGLGEVIAIAGLIAPWVTALTVRRG